MAAKRKLRWPNSVYCRELKDRKQTESPLNSAGNLLKEQENRAVFPEKKEAWKRLKKAERRWKRLEGKGLGRGGIKIRIKIRIRSGRH
jgi:hypothetical protein